MVNATKAENPMEPAISVRAEQHRWTSAKVPVSAPIVHMLRAVENMAESKDRDAVAPVGRWVKNMNL